jgi:hypothetical protein
MCLGPWLVLGSYYELLESVANRDGPALKASVEELRQ